MGNSFTSSVNGLFIGLIDEVSKINVSQWNSSIRDQQLHKHLVSNIKMAHKLSSIKKNQTLTKIVNEFFPAIIAHLNTLQFTYESSDNINRRNCLKIIKELTTKIQTLIESCENDENQQLKNRLTQLTLENQQLQSTIQEQNKQLNPPHNPLSPINAPSAPKLEN